MDTNFNIEGRKQIPISTNDTKIKQKHTNHYSPVP